MQLKSNEIDAWLKRPDAGVAALLVYGPDRGLVSERARAFAERSGVDLSDPFSVIRFDAVEIESAPGRLLGELKTIAMFAGKRLIWIRNAGAQKEIVEAVAAAEAGEAEALLLVEAGDLKKTAGLRAAVENGRKTLALPCYVDDSRGLDGLIDAECAAVGKRIGIDARVALRERLGGDRIASRGEIAKLVLYVGERQTIEVEDVLAIIGDASALSIDAAVDAILAGDAVRFDSAFAKALASGQHSYVVLSAAMRQFQGLALMRAAMDRDGRSASAAVAAARPPVFFARRGAIETALQRLDGGAISRALSRLQATVLSTRKTPDLSDEIARQALLGLALANRQRSGRAKN
ncbi:MAG: DNA polymerase III subunit delta [Phyllobacteriaceae bacterium]|nr:DNA polymerase III subunit delta [Phyllobacteriaceae bacterium]